MNKVNNEQSIAALHELKVGSIIVKSKYNLLLATLSEQLSLINEGVPYSIKSEMELNILVVEYVNICISHINKYLKCGVIERQKFPLSHELLRFFRDQSHHYAQSFEFKPIRSEFGIKFYVWPVMSQIPAVKLKFPEWCNRANTADLEMLLHKNGLYIDELDSIVRKKLSELNLMYLREYPLSEIGFGNNFIEGLE